MRLEDVFRKYNVKLTLLFGSRATGKILRGDYDIAVYFGEEEIDAQKVGLLAVELSERLNVKLKDLDLVIIEKAPITIAL